MSSLTDDAAVASASGPSCSSSRPLRDRDRRSGPAPPCWCRRRCSCVPHAIDRCGVEMRRARRAPAPERLEVLARASLSPSLSVGARQSESSGAVVSSAVRRRARMPVERARCSVSKSISTAVAALRSSSRSCARAASAAPPVATRPRSPAGAHGSSRAVSNEHGEERLLVGGGYGVEPGDLDRRPSRPARASGRRSAPRCTTSPSTAISTRARSHDRSRKSWTVAQPDGPALQAALRRAQSTGTRGTGAPTSPASACGRATPCRRCRSSRRSARRRSRRRTRTASCRRAAFWRRPWSQNSQMKPPCKPGRRLDRVPVLGEAAVAVAHRVRVLAHDQRQLAARRCSAHSTMSAISGYIGQSTSVAVCARPQSHMIAPS